MLTSSAVMSITNDLALSPHDRRSASQPPRRESATSNATRTRPHTVSAETKHSYAQRHADAGVPVDVLRELLDHDSMDTTRIYYRVGAQRQRAAVDKVTRHQFDRNGKHIWRQAQALLDAEHARRAIGQVAVPYGTCNEPTNVQAGGGACPFWFRCVGCDHFRTDVSYLPDLAAYLHDLLRDRERVLASVDLDEWAKAEALPSQEEIRRVKARRTTTSPRPE
jgi:hypothetical protein